jgi:hypothetical protein
MGFNDSLNPRSALRGLLGLLRTIERDGKHCADEAILAGLSMGAGIIQIPERLNQSNLLELQLLVAISCNLGAPIVAVLLITMRLSPLWVRVGPLRPRIPWLKIVLPAALVGFLLSFYFFLSSILAGILLSSRRDLIGEFQDVFGFLNPQDLLNSCLEASLYSAVACVWTLVESRKSAAIGRPVALVMSSVMVHVFAVVVVAKIVWILLSQLLR